MEDIKKMVDHLKDNVKELRAQQDTYQVTQTQILNRVNEIHVALVGSPEYKIEDNGGLCGEVKRMKKDVDGLKTWRTRLIAIGATISGIFGFIITLLTIKWREIFHSLNQ